ncbi:hypothetical protein [Orrella dioscoreae]|uniref:Transmembrane protein n=1 Tax=Orrella dioscoreae TaxID=1851544 RepID=A0A1C3K1F1_9BURK|nr:hypothetical protein [Orrella dioscoreae]SBT25311.1 hypothetical protein ODI_03614 [Orrella dioscoreae]SOE49092.1 hypothetical protein ODI_R1837 [Orrella dioscoreae]
MIPALPLSVIESWLLASAAVFVVCALVVFAMALMLPDVEAPELDPPEPRASRWSSKERIETTLWAVALAAAIAIACGAIGPTLDRYDEQRINSASH